MQSSRTNSLPTPRGRTPPTSRWSSTRWICCIPDGSTGFVLVSSDSDFTRLASRIREQGLPVYGIGKNDTPRAFRRACKQFIFIENLMPDVKSVPAPHADDATKESTSQTPTIKEPPCNAVPFIEAAMRSRDEDWVPLTFIGQYVREAGLRVRPPHLRLREARRASRKDRAVRGQPQRHSGARSDEARTLTALERRGEACASPPDQKNARYSGGHHRCCRDR